MNSKIFAAGTILSSLVFFGGGCANHLSSVDLATPDEQRTVIGTKYELKFTPETIRDSSYWVEIQKLESAEVTKSEIPGVKTIFTPYQWWREIYEVPTGLCLFPVSLGSHVLFLCTFGILPYDVPKNINELAFAGMNPALNWEDNDRIEEIKNYGEPIMLSRNIENIKLPLARKKIEVKSGSRSKVYETDDFGGFEFNFLAPKASDNFFPESRKVTFTLVDEQRKEELKQLFLTRSFLSKLKRARSRYNEYLRNPGGEALFDTVVYLESNGFETLAYLLEDSELASNDEQFRRDFESAAAQQ